MRNPGTISPADRLIPDYASLHPGYVLAPYATNHPEGGNQMLRAILTAAILLCASQAFAQELTAAQRDACMGDYEKYCKSVTPGGGRIIACLAKESDKLTPACRKVLEAAEKK